jgi:peptidase M28-like protein
MISTYGIWPYVWWAAPIALMVLAGFLALTYSMHMPGRSYTGPVEPLSQQELTIRDQLEGHVVMLSRTIGERNLRHYEALVAAACHVNKTLTDMGYLIRERVYTVEGRTATNLEIELPGGSRPEEIVVFGAHYDSIAGSPGANDNATGVAALLSLAGIAKRQRFARTLRFVAFVNEEPPYYRTRNMGSRGLCQGVRPAGRADHGHAVAGDHWLLLSYGWKPVLSFSAELFFPAHRKLRWICR